MEGSYSILKFPAAQSRNVGRHVEQRNQSLLETLENSVSLWPPPYCYWMVATEQGCCMVQRQLKIYKAVLECLFPAGMSMIPTSTSMSPASTSVFPANISMVPHHDYEYDQTFWQKCCGNYRCILSQMQGGITLIPLVRTWINTENTLEAVSLIVMSLLKFWHP